MVIGKDGIIRLAHRTSDAADNAPVDELLRAVATA